jgi:hypothetical protein
LQVCSVDGADRSKEPVPDPWLEIPHLAGTGWGIVDHLRGPRTLPESRHEIRLVDFKGKANHMALLSWRGVIPKRYGTETVRGRRTPVCLERFRGWWVGLRLNDSRNIVGPGVEFSTRQGETRPCCCKQFKIEMSHRSEHQIALLVLHRIT